MAQEGKKPGTIKMQACCGVSAVPAVRKQMQEDQFKVNLSYMAVSQPGLHGETRSEGESSCVWLGRYDSCSACLYVFASRCPRSLGSSELKEHDVGSQTCISSPAV